MDKQVTDTQLIINRGHEVFMPVMICTPLTREWCRALWSAHQALSNWGLAYTEQLS